MWQINMNIFRIENADIRCCRIANSAGRGKH
jgi:hypothetical protein